MADFPENKQMSVRAFEIAYALFRLASVSRSAAYAESLEVLGVSLIQSVARRNKKGISQVCAEALQILSLGMGLDFFAVGNGTKVLNLIQEMQTETQGTSSQPEEVDIIPKIFAEKEEPDSADSSDRRQEKDKTEPETPARIISVETYSDPEADRADTISGNVSGEARQLAILNHIRKSGNTKMRDLQQLFPDANERLLRYHLQKLGQKGLIEQVGSAAATYYRAAYPDMISGYKLPANNLP